jgi:HPt (histidine-containing phosphotransfer) domain-containing protein
MDFFPSASGDLTPSSAQDQDGLARALLERIATLPAMDREQVLSFRIRAARYVDLLRSLVAAHGNAMKRVREALQAGDTAAARQIVHSLRGDAAVLGAAQLTRVAAELEMKLRVKAKATDVSAEIEAELDALWAIADALDMPEPSAGA